MERELLLLGLLRMHDMHGYQLNEVIGTHFGGSVHLKKATAYDLLKKMTGKGWIASREEQEGNRPPRKVYSMTPQGKDAFEDMLRESLAEYRPAQFMNDVSLAFLDVLSAEEAVTLLQRRREKIETLLQSVLSSEQHPGSMQLAIEHQIHHLTAEQEWLDDVIKQVERGGENGNY